MARISKLAVFELLFALSMFTLGVYIGSSAHITIPSPYGVYENEVSRPATFFVACLPIAFAVLIILKYFFPEKAKKWGPAILLSCAAIFIVGYAFI